MTRKREIVLLWRLFLFLLLLDGILLAAWYLLV
jgi:hypothetical protein